VTIIAVGQDHVTLKMKPAMGPKRQYKIKNVDISEKYNSSKRFFKTYI